MSLRESLAKAVSESRVKEYGETYLSEALNTWRDCEKSISQTALALLITCVVTELIREGITNQVTIGGVQVSNFKTIQAFLPIVIAYLYSRLGSLASESSMNEKVFRTVFRALQPELYEAHLERALYPGNMTFLGSDRIRYMLPKNTPERNFAEQAGVVRLLVLIFVPIVYEAYLFIELFAKMRFTSAILWISLALSAVLVLSGFWGFVAAVTVATDDKEYQIPK
jgi:hypothetical protein